MLQHCQVLDRPRRFADHTKHDFDPMPLPTKCLGWAAEQLLDVRLCVAIAPSPGKRTSHRARLRASTLPQGAQGEDAIVCCHIPSPEGKDGSCKHTKPVECLGWAVEPLLDVLLCAAVAPSPEGSDEY